MFGHFLLPLWPVHIKFDRTCGRVPFLGLIQIDGITASLNLELRELACMLPRETGLFGDGEGGGRKGAPVADGGGEDLAA